jgi:glycosyltransferase involved in cell wall biosynthesis
MKILFCISSLSGGGAEAQLYFLSTGLSKSGHEVHVFYIWDNSVIDKDWGLVHLHKCNVKSNYSLKILFNLFKLMSNYKFDIVQSWVFQMDIIVGFLIRFFNFKWILREPTSSKYYDSSTRNKLRVFLSTSASIIVSNSFQGRSYWESNKIRTQLKVVFNGIPYEEIEDAICKPNNTIISYGEYILYVGRLVEDGTGNKNVSKLILAFNQILKEKERIKLLIVGVGKDSNRLQSLVKQLNIQNQVFFLGYQNSETVYQLMNNSLLFVSLSEYEGCPNTVLEALYCCDRILLSRIDEHTSIFPEINENLFVDPNDTNEIASNIMAIINNPPSQDTFLKLTVKYRIPRMVNDYTSIYHELLEKI